jgi:two-component sensor histidine kinase
MSTEHNGTSEGAIMAPRLADVALETKPAVDSRDAAAEANHRIANNLAIIAGYVRSELFSLSREKTPDFLSIRRSLEHLSVRIDAIGRLHRLLTSSSPAASVEISAYLREIADAAQCSLAHAERPRILFSFTTKAWVTAQQAVAIGAIASEALVNSIKYSHPRNDRIVITIGCKRMRRNGLVIEIKDDGVGRRHHVPGKKYRRAGTSIMQTLAQSLNATLEIVDGRPGHIVRFELPLFDQPIQ